MPMSRANLGSVILLGASVCAHAAADDGLTRLLRYPDVSKTQIAFDYAGDIYVVGRDGGVAQRLTSHEGEELYPKFSPDGQWIAFSAEYSGTREVYVMPASGGAPRQLTFYSDVGAMPFRGGTDYRVLDWTPDGKNVVVRMNRVPFDERGGRPYLVPVEGGMETPLAVPETGGGALSPDGTKFVYTPIDADWRGWKRYRGGRAPDVWIYDLKANTSLQLTNFRGMDMQPSWVGDAVYFASDRDGTLNLYSIAPTGGEAKKLTDFHDFDVLWPSGGPDAVVFENGGQIWRTDAGTGQTLKVPIQVRGDTPHALPQFKKVAANIESFSIAPHGERAVFGARGEVFTVPAKDGEVRNLSRTPEAREINVTWSPDGRSIAYLSDASGEYEIWVRAQDGSGAPRQVTHDGDVWRFQPIWSPDSKRLAYADKKQRVRIVDVADGHTVDVDHSDRDDITEYTWSPDSSWLAYTKTSDSRLPSIWVYSLASGKPRQLTSSAFGSSSPAFDPKGRYIYFVSNRDYNLTFSAYEFNYLYTDAAKLFAAPLAADGPALNPPKSDEASTSAAPAPKGDDAKKKDEKPKSEPGPAKVRIDFDGFDRRVVALNAPGGNYVGVAANAEAVFYLSGNPQQGGLALKMYSLEDGKAEDVVGKGVTGYELSEDGKKILVRTASGAAIVDAKADRDVSKSALALDKLELKIDPRTEWRQEYADAWRILRDWFYDEGNHGGRERWNAIRARYAPLVDSLASREDLNYIFHEIAGELNSGHVYVERGASDDDKPARKPGGMLGAEIVSDRSGNFRIAKVFEGENWNPATRSPLTEAGVNVGAGEFILAVDGVDAKSVKNFYALLEGKADRVVDLKVAKDAGGAGARTVKVKTSASERGLRYLDWVASRRAMVDRLSAGRIGYIHVPNTAVEGNRELAKGFAANAHKDALIVDDRYNGGGFIPDRMIELLARKPLNYWKRRGVEPQATPLLSHDGPKAMLINGLSSSGGDAFPYYFHKLKLGPLIGTRTWGGLIGISGNPSVADGGQILAATFRFMDTDGHWAVENEGVSPDIEVIDRPESIAAGHDPSLEKAVDVLLDELKKNPPHEPKAPAAPTEFR